MISLFAEPWKRLALSSLKRMVGVRGSALDIGQAQRGGRARELSLAVMRSMMDEQLNQGDGGIRDLAQSRVFPDCVAVRQTFTGYSLVVLLILGS
jgi:hypothetical protein